MKLQEVLKVIGCQIRYEDVPTPETRALDSFYFGTDSREKQVPELVRQNLYSHQQCGNGLLVATNHHVDGGSYFTACAIKPLQVVTPQVAENAEVL